MKTYSHNPTQPGIKLLVWPNIVIQALFPLAVAFTPVIAGAEQHFLQLAAAPESAQSTQVYTLGVGETAASVAKKYNLTLEQLRGLNQFRTFAHGLNGLRPGDDVDVPVITVQVKKTESGTSTTSSSSAGEEGDEQAKKVARYASQTGSFLSSGPERDATISMVRSMASVAAGSEIQQWLSRFGTARVQLDTDKDFSLKNSQLDLLIPFYEQKDRLVFTQGSLHRTDDRTQSNLGLGYRWFADNWMLGANTFLDYDLSRDHARLGLGLEYWRDFLKLGANTYQRLTSWKNSPDLDDYEERPANGWDIRAQAWIPSLPQLGGKLIYEQYYGDEVGLFGRDNRQRNPHAITASVNYTPVPLLTFTAEQRQGKSGENDTRFGMEMNYQLGVPWQKQINPDAVAALRSLAGSRHDLVERNNNIVLEYRKKEVISLKTADQVTGYAEDQKSLGVSVSSKYGLERIDWSTPGLLAAGGKIVRNGTDYFVVLPDWKSGPGEVNTYILSAVAVDRKGNQSNRSETRVTVQAPVVSAAKSTFTPANSTLPADGKSTEMLTLTVKDGQGNVADIPVTDITLDTGGLSRATVAALVKKSTGVFETNVTAGTDVGVLVLTPAVRGTKLSSARISFVKVYPDRVNSAIKTDQATYMSGSDMTVTVTLKDMAGNAVTGMATALDTGTVVVANATLKPGSNWQDHNDGSYSAVYTAKTAGTGLKAAVTLSGWSDTVESATYAVTLMTTLPKDISVNGYTFAANAGFPTTGFKEAKFTLELTGGNPSDYDWRSDAPWVSVNNGEVSFTGTGTKDKVTITGTPKSGVGSIITYSFALKSWFTEISTKTWYKADTECNALAGSGVPTVAQLTDNASHPNGYTAKRGILGGLWSEWGNMLNYSGAGFSNFYYWTSVRSDIRPNAHYQVSLNTGFVGYGLDYDFYNGICRQGF
ncbi:invasin [Salmonella enterica]|uniref:Invasin n=1 Tax=Salmonella enterica TaxID=28901 RepID=A0A5T3EN56_SALER|nr:invasin [Salmonella enterica]EBN5059216.1 invasin [Salmonella enterica]EGP2631950.1 invasin [Salmonella enterica]